MEDIRVDFKVKGWEKEIGITDAESYRDALEKGLAYARFIDPNKEEADLTPCYIWKGETSVTISLIEDGYWFLSFMQPMKSLPNERLHCDAASIGEKAIGYLDHFNATAGRC